MENAEVKKLTLLHGEESAASTKSGRHGAAVSNQLFVIKKWYDNVLQVLVKVGKLELLEDDEEGSRQERIILQLLNCGGLVTVSDLEYLTCMHALQLKAEFFDDDYTQELFLASSFLKLSLSTS
ncbi:Hypothetical protein FKW44_006414 [Caligus rogercresseyi]|uniref:Uncharacterized protein n=1 Tax=Caligus rogercresseyi TaxID=217165 RepID=A0A7T8KDC0_CALRO|nr:Hypothetical protein FKW44_006414 [Caligus rogercresseyi]